MKEVLLLYSRTGRKWLVMLIFIQEKNISIGLIQDIRMISKRLMKLGVFQHFQMKVLLVATVIHCIIKAKLIKLILHLMFHQVKFLPLTCKPDCMYFP